MTQRFLFGLLFLLFFSLTACEPTGPKVVKPDNSAEMAAVAAEQSGDYLAAAEQYRLIAETAVEPQKSQFYLRAAMAYWLANQAAESTETITQIDLSTLNNVQRLDLAILKANIALYNHQPQQAITLLAVFDLDIAVEQQQIQALEIKIKAYDALDKQVDKAVSLIALSPLLAPGKQAQNQDEIWLSLMSLNTQTLDLLNPGTPPAINSGWFALAYIVKTYERNPNAFVVALEDWQRNYPNHPADKRHYQQALKAAIYLPDTVTDIAVLLPDSGPYKPAADAIKQGILAAHFNANSRIKLHFLPIDTNVQTGASNVWQQYQQAVAQKADIVIGPLSKKSIQVLADADDLTIPVLALNRVDATYQKANLFQFGLAPEDDAIAVANYATAQGFERALVLSANNAWGKRIAGAFEQQWADNEGVLLNRGQYDESKSDFAAIIKPLLSLDESEKRYQHLKQTTRQKFEFEPRRRQDIDFIFLAAKPLKARQIAPQLKFHRSGRVPIIATSHAYTGAEDSQQDVDLNGVVINDIPWVFSDLATNDPSYTALQNADLEHFDRFIRLYALGADSYRLIDKINVLSSDPDVSYSGATGTLSINENGHVHRITPWGVFRQGKLKPFVVSEPK